jgi:cytoskeletal protein RodZ
VGQFGDKFRKAREKKGTSLDDASNVTKIGARMLQAIEEENFDQLPGGVFNKGFIRAYAKHLGINDQEAVSEYLECLRQEQVRAQNVWEPPTPPVRPTAPEKPPAPVAAKPQIVKAPAPTPITAPVPPPATYEELPDLQLPKVEHVRPPRQKYLDRGKTEIPWRVVAATALVLLLVLVLWRRHVIASRPVATESSATVPESTPGSNVSTAGSSGANSSSSGPPGSSGAASSGSATNTNTPANSSAAQGSGTQALAAHPASQTNSPANSKTADASDSDESEVTTRSFITPPAAPAEKPGVPLMLVIRATENSSISVTADGKNVSQETLIAPAHTSIRASREIVARVGNAAGVTFLWNGKEIPADGAESETKTFVFDAQGMHVVGAGQNR